MLVFEKLKKLFQRKKPEDGLEEDDFLEEAEEKETDADISYTDDEEPEEQAKTIKKKAIMVAGGAAVLFAVSAIASNVFLGGSGKGNSDKALSGPVSAATPADKLPDKYSDIDKDKKQNTATPHTGQTTPANSPGRTTVSEGSRTPSTSAAVPVNTSRTTGVSSMPAAVPVMPTGNGAASRGESSAAQAAAKEKEAADSSELAFKVAANISQQQAEKSVVQPLANAASMGSGIVQTASYSNPMASTYRSSLVVDAGSYVLSAGAVIQATLLTGVTSDVAHGDVVAQVRQNIYDSLTGTHLLIPQGSRVIGSSADVGGKRINVVFKRIILPSGASLALPDQQAIDGTGYPGLMDKYNDHRGKAYRTAFMSALLSAAAQSATGNSSGSDNRSPGQEAVAGAVSSILKTGQALVEKDANAQATVEIEPGFQFSIFINQDLLIGEYGDE